jgi:hypothetical protein
MHIVENIYQREKISADGTWGKNMKGEEGKRGNCEQKRTEKGGRGKTGG